MKFTDGSFQNIHAETQKEAQRKKEHIRTELEREALLAEIMPEPVASAEAPKLSVFMASRWMSSTSLES